VAAPRRFDPAELGLALEEPLDPEEPEGALDLADPAPPERSGECKLLVALLAGAVEDYLAQAPPDPLGLRAVPWQRWRRAHRSARSFLFADSAALELACHAAQVDAGALRSRLRARIGAKWGGKYEEAVRETGYDEGTLRNSASVCRRVEMSRRRDKLSFAHHAEVAKLPAEEQETGPR